MKCRLVKENVGDRPCVLCYPARVEQPIPLFLCHVGPEAEALFAEVFRFLPKDGPRFALCAVTDVSRDRDYTPWQSSCLPERVFSGGADAYLNFVRSSLAPWAERATPSCARYHLGYSLGGLCALYALTREEGLSGAASVSGALWYPGFVRFFQENRPDAPVYCSLGRAESRTRNPAMCAGAQCAQEIAARPGDRFEWTNGNHFFEIPQRIALAVRRLLEDRE